MNNTLVVRNAAQKALFENEIRGQMSDGLWENCTVKGHWQPWSYCKVVVGENVGRNFDCPKANYHLTKLVEYVGDRMVSIVQRATAMPSSERLVTNELRDLMKIMKIRLSSPPWGVDTKDETGVTYFSSILTEEEMAEQEMCFINDGL